MKRLFLPLASCALLTAPAHAILDLNSNGVSDVWERLYNDGELYDQAFDLQADPDADGWSSLTESIAGTDPRSSLTPHGMVRKTVLSYPQQPGLFVLSFNTQPGKIYHLKVSPELEQWAPFDSFPATGNSISLAIDVRNQDETVPEKLFWRVEVEDIDSDGDTLTDWEELQLGTDPLLVDTDGDGVPDGVELRWGLDPLDATDAGLTAPGSAFTYLQHHQNGTNPPPPGNPGGSGGGGGPPPTPVEAFENTAFAFIPLNSTRYVTQVTDSGDVFLVNDVWRQGILHPDLLDFGQQSHQAGAPTRAGYHSYAIYSQSTGHGTGYIGRLGQSGAVSVSVPSSVEDDAFDQIHQLWQELSPSYWISMSLSPNGPFRATIIDVHLLEDGSSFGWQTFSRNYTMTRKLSQEGQTYTTPVDNQATHQWLTTSAAGSSQKMNGANTALEIYHNRRYNAMLGAGGLGAQAFAFVTESIDGGPYKLLLKGRNGNTLADLSALGFNQGLYYTIDTSRNGHIGQGDKVYHLPGNTLESAPLPAMTYRRVNDLGDLLVHGSESEAPAVLGRKFIDPGTGAVTWAKRVLNDELLPVGWSDLKIRRFSNTMPLERQQALEALNAYPPKPEDAPVPLLAGSAVLNGQRQAVMLLPMEVMVVDRDDPTRKWGDEKDHNSGKPIYAGESNGDMVRWRLAGADNWTNVTFTWSAEGPGGVTITGPTGGGKNEWTIHDSDDDTATDWLKWKPGKWKIKVQIGSTQAEFDQEVGVRTTDVVAVGWINPQEVPLNSAGMPSDMTRYYPPSGTFVMASQKLLTLAHLGLVSQGAKIRPGPAVAMTATEKEYMLNWLFKYGSNTAPPASFADAAALEDFKNERTNYKLFNRFQIRYLVNEDGTEFKGQPVILNQGTVIGVTKEPIFGRLVPGTSGRDEGKKQIKNNKIYHQTNDGSPDDLAVDAFNTLMNPLKWNHIGSTISFGIDFDFRFELLNQIYPTYFIYERQEDGRFELKEQRPQAPNPKDNFNSAPYDPPALGPAPFIIP